jgi:hypothetical protein
MPREYDRAAFIEGFRACLSLDEFDEPRQEDEDPDDLNVTVGQLLDSVRDGITAR